MRFRLVLVLLLSVGLLAVGAAPALALGTVDQKQLDVSNGAGYQNLQLIGQTFTAGITGVLDSAAVHPMSGWPIAGDALEIRAVSDGMPTTTVLASQTISSTVSGDWATTTFASPASVVAGTQYALLVSDPISSRMYFNIGPNHKDPYASGTAVCKGANSPWLQSDYDLGFITYVTPATPAYQPDGWIRRGTHPWVGNNIYNADGDQQTRTAKPLIGAQVLFRIAVQNDGNVPDRYTIQAIAAVAPGYRIRYFSGRKQITGVVTNGTFTTPIIAPGDRYVIKAYVRATADAGPSVSCLVTLTSVTDTSRVDGVGFVVRPN